MTPMHNERNRDNYGPREQPQVPGTLTSGQLECRDLPSASDKYTAEDNSSGSTSQDITPRVRPPLSATRFPPRACEHCHAKQIPLWLVPTKSGSGSAHSTSHRRALCNACARHLRLTGRHRNAVAVIRRRNLSRIRSAAHNLSKRTQRHGHCWASPKIMNRRRTTSMPQHQYVHEQHQRRQIEPATAPTDIAPNSFRFLPDGRTCVVSLTPALAGYLMNIISSCPALHES